MQTAVSHAGRAREVDRPRELRDERQRGVDRRGCVVPHRDVERLGRDVLLRAIRDRPFDPGRDRLDDGRMEEAGFRRAVQLVRERVRLFGDDVEAEHLDRDETIARGFIRPEDRAQRANADLMQHPERAECGRW